MRYSCIRIAKNITEPQGAAAAGKERDEAFLEKHASWENRLREVANIAEVIIAKQRMRPIGVEKLSFNPELSRFTDL